MTAIMLGELKYLSSKEAAEVTGYTQDYVGQLARGGQIEAKRVSGMWYVNEESLKAYKAKADEFVPTPPQSVLPRHNAETSVSFDGKDYVSTSRASKLTGYNQDYVGQLARSGEILSRQVGNRWYVDRESLLAHKKEKDALLAAVQVESVGLAKPSDAVANNVTQVEGRLDAAESMLTEQSNSDDSLSEKTNNIIDVSGNENEEVTHFAYVEERKPLIPEMQPVEEVIAAEPMPEFPRRKVTNPVFEEYHDAESLVVKEEIQEPVLKAVEEEADTAQVEETTIPIRVRAAEIIEEHVYIEEDSTSAPTTVTKSYRKRGGTGTILAISGVAVAAAVGTITYIGSTLGVFNIDDVISLPKNAQNAAVGNSFVEKGSKFIPESIRSLFSKELTYRR